MTNLPLQRKITFGDKVQYDIREYAARAIAALGPEANTQSIKEILQERVLEDRNIDVRTECANTIAKIGAWDDDMVKQMCEQMVAKPAKRRNIALLIGKLNLFGKPYKNEVVLAFSKALQDEKDDGTRLEIGRVLNLLIHASSVKTEEDAKKDVWSILYNRRSVARVKCLQHMRAEAPILAQLEDFQNPWLLK